MQKALSNQARNAILQFHAMLAENSGAVDVTKTFAATEPLEQRIMGAILESADFLKMITVEMVESLEGEALRVGVAGLLAKRTAVTPSNPASRRQPNMATDPTASKYRCEFTEFDAGIGYTEIDKWAPLKNFPALYMAAVYAQVALDKISIGFNGTSAAATTDPVANPNGEDVNKGWLQILKEQNSGNYMEDGATAGTIKIYGTNPDYVNADQLAYDLYSGIPMHHRTGNEVVIVGEAIVAYDMNKAIGAHAGTPSEKAIGITELSKTYGGRRAIVVPKMPSTGMAVVDPKNLQMLTEKGSIRRHSKDEPEWNRMVEYISSNDAYAVGNLQGMTAVNAANVQLGD